MGMACGAVLISIWGGPERTVRGVMLALGCCGAFMAMIGMSRTPLLVGFGCFSLFVMTPVLASLSNSIWQCEVPAAMQGRVFCIRDLVAGTAMAASYVISPWLSLLMEPMAGGRVSSIGNLYMLMGGLTIVLSLLALRHPALRDLGRSLPVEALPACSR